MLRRDLPRAPLVLPYFLSISYEPVPPVRDSSTGDEHPVSPIVGSQSIRYFQKVLFAKPIDRWILEGTVATRASGPKLARTHDAAGRSRCGRKSREEIDAWPSLSSKVIGVGFCGVQQI